MRRAAVLLLAASISLGGCVTTEGGGANQNTLTLGAAGAAGGALIGGLASRRNPLTGTLIGGVLGGAAGAAIGSHLDAESERRRQEALSRAAAAPMRPAQWTGRDSGTGGRVQFQAPPRRNASGRTCATVQETITIGGQPQQADRETCRNLDGTWT